jgi:hypothetical protein
MTVVAVYLWITWLLTGNDLGTYEKVFEDEARTGEIFQEHERSAVQAYSFGLVGSPSRTGNLKVVLPNGKACRFDFSSNKIFPFYIYRSFISVNGKIKRDNISEDQYFCNEETSEQEREKMLDILLEYYKKLNKIE